MTLQMESGARACVECGGSGESVLRGCSHQGNCPCGADRAFPCGRCAGAGIEACTFCGDPSVLFDIALGDCCAPCFERFAVPAERVA